MVIAFSSFGRASSPRSSRNTGRHPPGNDEDFKGDVRSSTSENLIACVVQTENGLIKEITKVISWLSQFLLSFQVELINKFTSLKFIYTI